MRSCQFSGRSVLVAVLVWFALPGVLFARLLYGPQPESRMAALLAGPAWGYVLSSLGLLALWAVGTRNLALLMLAPILGGVAALPARRLAGTLTLPRFRALTLARVPCFSSL